MQLPALGQDPAAEGMEQFPGAPPDPAVPDDSHRFPPKLGSHKQCGV